jgi:hypothetical protein
VALQLKPKAVQHAAFFSPIRIPAPRDRSISTLLFLAFVASAVYWVSHSSALLFSQSHPVLQILALHCILGLATQQCRLFLFLDLGEGSILALALGWMNPTEFCRNLGVS